MGPLCGSGLNAKASRQSKLNFEGANRGPNSDNQISIADVLSPSANRGSGRTLPALQPHHVTIDAGPFSSRRNSIVPGADGYDDLMEHERAPLLRKLPSYATIEPSPHSRCAARPAHFRESLATRDFSRASGQKAD